MNADGKVVIHTELEVSDSEKQLAKLKEDYKRLETELKRAQADKARADKEYQRILDQVTDSMKKQEAQAKRLAEKRAELQATQGGADRYSVQSDQAAQRLYEMRNAPKGTYSGEDLLAQKETARAYGALSDEAMRKVVTLTAEVERAEEKMAALREEGAQLEVALGAADDRARALGADVTAAKGALASTADQAGALQAEIAQTETTTYGMGTALSLANDRMAKFVTRIKGLAKRVFVFTVITMALRQLRTWLSGVIKTNTEASAAIAKLKGALLTLAQPIVEMVIPAFTALVNVLTRVVAAMATLISRLFGSTVAGSASAAEKLDKEKKALDGVGASAKKAGKSMASFDEINQLTGSGGGGAASGATAPDFTGVVGAQIGVVEALVGAALLAVGAILTFSGANVPVGIALMAAGALTLAGAIVANWDTVSALLEGPIGFVLGLVGGALLVVGAILTFSGANIPLGLGLLAAGAVMYATALATNWGSITEIVQGEVGALVTIVSTALLVIGMLLLFSGAGFSLGLGLIAVGAVGLATAVAANWGSLSELLGGALGAVLAIVGTAFLVLGTILAFSGVNIPLGLGLIVIGAAGMAYAIAANWAIIPELMQGPLGIIVGLLGGALLVIGAILTFTGAALPLGIALMVLGAAGLAVAIAPNWETIQNALQGPIGAVVAILSTALLALGGVLLFTGANIPLGIGLLVAGAVGLATTIAANWEVIPELMQGPVGAIVGIISAALLVLGVILLFTGAGIPLGLGLIAVGAIGLATAIAPNWDFLTEKVRDIWNSIKEFWNANIAKFLTADYWKELGSGIIDSFLSGLKSAWETVVGWAKGVVKWFKDLFGGAKDSATEVVNAGNAQAASSGTRQRSVSTFAIPRVSMDDIPHLAAGRVIPPNKEFMAVLGDQKRGTNIETPLATMVQAFKQAMAEMGGTGNCKVTLVIQPGPGLTRYLKYELDEETARQGVCLVQGV